jgi:hypothetical protein
LFEGGMPAPILAQALNGAKTFERGRLQLAIEHLRGRRLALRPDTARSG